MAILVIGNGFDLAHHLPTQYADFLDFVNDFKNLENGGKESEYVDFIDEIRGRNKLYNEVQGLINENLLLRYFLSIYEERCKEGKAGWIDFESEISLIVQNLDAGKQDVQKKYLVSKEAVKLDKAIADFLEPIFYDHQKLSKEYTIAEHLYSPKVFDNQARRILDDLNRLTRLLEIYLHEYVEKLEKNYRISDFEGKNINKVLSFNYTDTYKKYYDPEGKAKYCFIHGRTKDGSLEECNLVLGIDEYLPLERKDTDNEYVWFKKFYQRIFKETESDYLDWINQFEGSNKNRKNAGPSHLDLYIYGHSLDVTDKDVLSRLILMENTTTHIFYHSRKALAKQISNLVKDIGEDNLIRMTGGKDKSIRFIPAQKAIIK